MLLIGTSHDLLCHAISHTLYQLFWILYFVGNQKTRTTQDNIIDRTLYKLGSDLSINRMPMKRIAFRSSFIYCFRQMIQIRNKSNVENSIHRIQRFIRNTNTLSRRSLIRCNSHIIMINYRIRFYLVIFINIMVLSLRSHQCHCHANIEIIMRY